MVKSIVKGNDLGQPLSEEMLDNFRDDQVQQLYELLKTTQEPPALSGEQMKT